MSTADFNKLTIRELKEFALENGVNLDGAKLKNEIVKKLKNHKPESDCGCDMKKRDNEELTPDDSTIEPEKTYPDCFEICGYAKEIYDANRNTMTFNTEQFKTAMEIYSMIFCFEKDLRDGKITGYTSYEGTKALLDGSRETTKKLLEESYANEIEKNDIIWNIHTKNILGLLEKQ